MMLFFRKSGVVLMLFVIFAALLCSSCSTDEKKQGGLGQMWYDWTKGNKTKPRPPADKRRAVKIINKTGCKVTYFSVSVADGESILEEDNHELSKESGWVIKDIQPAYREKREFTIRLVDRYDRIYEKTFPVASNGETGTPITNTDRKSEGFFTDKKKDLDAFMNGGCKE